MRSLWRDGPLLAAHLVARLAARGRWPRSPWERDNESEKLQTACQLLARDRQVAVCIMRRRAVGRPPRSPSSSLQRAASCWAARAPQLQNSRKTVTLLLLQIFRFPLQNLN